MKPYKFSPFLKTTIWGGYQIAPFKGIFTAQPNIGESWEVSGVPEHESVAVERGLVDDVDLGLTLTQLIDKYKELLVGRKVYKKYGNKFPLLVKFIDSRQDLSVQVHPDDKLAMQRHGCAGKTEMWYVIKSDVGSKIYAGLNKSITPEDYKQLATAEVVNGHSPMQDVIAAHEAHEGDLFFFSLLVVFTPSVQATSLPRFRKRATSPIAYMTTGARTLTVSRVSCTSKRPRMPLTIRCGQNIEAAMTALNPSLSSSTVLTSRFTAS